MKIDLTGVWNIELNAENGIQRGNIQIPGILQAQGYGNDITFDTQWMSSLHDDFWFEREEYKLQNQISIPFLAQPPKHFIGKAYYKRMFEISYTEDEIMDMYNDKSRALCGVHRLAEAELASGNISYQKLCSLTSDKSRALCGVHRLAEAELASGNISYQKLCPLTSDKSRALCGVHRLAEAELASGNIENSDTLNWYLFIELVHWRTKVYIDGIETGGDCSLCTPHVILCGELSLGQHEIVVEVDNSMQYPYRPDGHEVSDALGATWNGMAGEVLLLTEDELVLQNEKKKAYAKKHQRHIEIKNGMFYVDGRPEYFRGTHFGGDYPITGYPEKDKAWWDRICHILKEWGLNFIRCHSYCPPDAAFLAADEAGIYIQAECGMWNNFEDDSSMNIVLREETRRILEQFGHHPSFVLFSPTNEPSGNWYNVLRQWVDDTKKLDKELGYEGRRVYTAQSGWFYDVAPSEITGTDYLYFHRSAYGPLYGGMIRNQEGWKGKDYSPSIEGTQLPVICHEMGQWTAYPNFDVIEQFVGYLQPSNYRVFIENCKRQGLYSLNHEFAYASGRNQLRLYKEDIEANLRTSKIYGFEMLDLHDYLGQGTALVGILDAFWNQKGYVNPNEFRKFCDKVVLLARFSTYVFENRENVDNNTEISIEVCNFDTQTYNDCVIAWWITDLEKEYDNTITHDEISVGRILMGQNTCLPNIVLPIDMIKKNSRVELEIFLYNKVDVDTYEEITSNNWEFFVYCTDKNENVIYDYDKQEDNSIVYTRIWNEAKNALVEGKRVIYSPRLSELSYECPPVSIKNVFWNTQMGAKWERSLGLLIDKNSPIFEEFPTDKTGGWQWEEILSYARAFDISDFGYSDFNLEGVIPIVRVIDDWNRNLPLALIFEVAVDKAKLLVVSADLEYNQKARPAACALKAALLRYAASPAFQPRVMISKIDMDKYINKRIFPIYRMEQLVKNIVYPLNANIKNGRELVTANPEQVTLISMSNFPINIVIEFNRKIEVNGVLYVPDQTARKRRGFIKEYIIRIQDAHTKNIQEISGILKNTSLSQEIHVQTAFTDKIEFSILSIYGDKNLDEWIVTKDGYYKVKQDYTAEVKIGGVHVISNISTKYKEVFIKQPIVNRNNYKKTDIES